MIRECRRSAKISSGFDFCTFLGETLSGNPEEFIRISSFEERTKILVSTFKKRDFFYIDSFLFQMCDNFFVDEFVWARRQIQLEAGVRMSSFFSKYILKCPIQTVVNIDILACLGYSIFEAYLELIFKRCGLSSSDIILQLSNIRVFIENLENRFFRSPARRVYC